MPHDEQASKHFASSTDFQACSVREPSISELAGLDMGRPPKDKKDRDERWNRGRDNPRILAASLSMQERDAQTLPAPITTPPTLDPHRPISGTTVKRTCKVQAKNGTWRTVDAISTHRKRQKDGELYLGVTKALASRLGYKINRFGNGKRLQHDMKTGLIKCRGTISLPFWKANGQQSVEVVGVWDGPNCSFEVMVDEGAVKEYTMPKRKCLSELSICCAAVLTRYTRPLNNEPYRYWCLALAAPSYPTAPTPFVHANWYYLVYRTGQRKSDQRAGQRIPGESTGQ
ncbi:hypothetical protein AUP68_06047 [Ilyonectria robusta]